MSLYYFVKYLLSIFQIRLIKKKIFSLSILGVKKQGLSYKIVQFMYSQERTDHFFFSKKTLLMGNRRSSDIGRRKQERNSFSHCDVARKKDRAIHFFHIFFLGNKKRNF